jgi:hypothetical protein
MSKGIRIERLAWLSVCLLVMTITWNGVRIGGGALGSAAMALAFLSVLAHIVLDRDPVPLPPWLVCAGCGFLVAALLTLVFPPNLELANRAVVQQEGLLGPYPPFLPPRSDLSALIEFELSIVVIPVMVMVVARTRSRCLTLLDLWAAGGVINAAVGLADYGGLHLAPYAIEAHRSSGLTIHPNYLALSSVLALPAAMLWIGRSRVRTVAGVVALALLVGGVYASGSRAGTIASLLAILATAVAIPRLRRVGLALLPFAGMGFILLLLFTDIGAQVIHQVRLGAGDTSAVGSDLQRSMDARLALDQISARPLEGVGFSVITDAHVIYLQILAAGGLIAGAAFLTFVGGLAGAARRAWGGVERDAVAAAAVTIAVWLINGVVDNQVADKYLYVVPGILLALSRVTVRVRSRSVAPSPSMLPTVAVT